MNVLRVVALCLIGGTLYSQTRWTPALNTSWQWQLTQPLDLSIDVEMYDVDLFTTEASTVAALHARGRKAVCYVSVGTFEPWRPDANRFPASVKGRALEDFPDEHWLDIRRWDILGPIMEARLDMCKAKGFDGVEPDNVDAYVNRSGFPLTGQDQITFNRRIADAAHARGLSVGLKNDLDQVQQLLPYFDWALNEQCFQYRECGSLTEFVRAGKAVFTVEYEVKPEAFCSQANALNFNSLHKNYDLDAYRVPCRASSPAPPPPASAMRINAVVNAANNRVGPVSAGAIVALYGAGIGPAAGASARLAGSQFPTTIEGFSLTFDGLAAPLLFARQDQVLAVVPYALAGAARTRAVLKNGTDQTEAFEVTLATASPGIFTADASGAGPAAALNQDGSYNSAAQPAAAGSVVTLFATGAGILSPLPRDGALSEAPYALPTQAVTAAMGGAAAEVLYAGAAPGLVSGVLQVNLRVPAGTRGPSAEVVLQVGTVSSGGGVTVFVR